MLSLPMAPDGEQFLGLVVDARELTRWLPTCMMRFVVCAVSIISGPSE